MTWIRAIAPESARGRLKKQYEAAIARAGRVYHIVRTMSVAPAILEASMQLFARIAHARRGLTRAQRELVAVVVSVTNDCHY